MQPKCTATAKRTGTSCNAFAVQGRSVCRMHGGTSPVGLASSQFKHGRYSRALPSHLRDRYQAAVADPNLLVLSDEIALLDTRLGDLVARLGEPGPAGPLWEGITDLLERRRKLVESERKRLVELHQLVRVEDAMLLVRQVVESVKRYVSDPHALRGISADVERLLTFDPGHGSRSRSAD